MKTCNSLKYYELQWHFTLLIYSFRRYFNCLRLLRKYTNQSKILIPEFILEHIAADWHSKNPFICMVLINNIRGLHHYVFLMNAQAWPKKAGPEPHSSHSFLAGTQSIRCSVLLPFCAAHALNSWCWASLSQTAVKCFLLILSGNIARHD